MFSGVDFVSYYIELPVMAIMFIGWKLWKKTKLVKLDEMDLETDVYVVQPGEFDRIDKPGWKGKFQTTLRWIF